VPNLSYFDYNTDDVEFKSAFDIPTYFCLFRKLTSKPAVNIQ